MLIYTCSYVNMTVCFYRTCILYMLLNVVSILNVITQLKFIVTLHSEVGMLDYYSS